MSQFLFFLSRSIEEERTIEISNQSKIPLARSLSLLSSPLSQFQTRARTDEDMGDFEAINKEKNLTVSRWKMRDEGIENMDDLKDFSGNFSFARPREKKFSTFFFFSSSHLLSSLSLTL